MTFGGDMETGSVLKKLEEAFEKHDLNLLTFVSGLIVKILMEKKPNSVTKLLKGFDNLDYKFPSKTKEEEIFFRTVRAMANSASDFINEKVEVIELARRHRSVLKILADKAETTDRLSELLNSDPLTISIWISKLAQFELVETYGMKKEHEITAFGHQIYKQLG